MQGGHYLCSTQNECFVVNFVKRKHRVAACSPQFSSAATFGTLKPIAMTQENQSIAAALSLLDLLLPASAAPPAAGARFEAQIEIPPALAARIQAQTGASGALPVAKRWPLSSTSVVE